jgi:hypothetical protein
MGATVTGVGRGRSNQRTAEAIGQRGGAIATRANRAFQQALEGGASPAEATRQALRSVNGR